jgi:hypothetical protein
LTISTPFGVHGPICWSIDQVTSAPAARMNEVASKIVEPICRNGMRSLGERRWGFCGGNIERV